MRHSGKAYHEYMLGSPHDQKARERFQQLVFRAMPSKGTILDFGAGTGIDARCYAAHGYQVLVHEPSEPNLDYLREHCRQEIASGRVAVADMSATRKAEMIVANFAVLNLISDHRALFARFGGLLSPPGLVLVSFLNPFFLGDARYAWWRSNLRTLVETGAYAIDGEFDRIYRFTPSVLRRAAEPGFVVLRCAPAWPSRALSRYIFMQFQKR